MKFINFLICMLFTGVGIAQVRMVNKIKKSDQIYDSQLAFDFLDSINRQVKLDENVKVLLYEKLAQRALEVNNFAKLTEVCVKGVNLSQKLKLDSAQAFFYKYIGISQSYNQKLNESIISFKKSADIANRANLKVIEATNYNNIGGNLIDLKDFNQAEFYLKKSISLSDKNGFPSLRNKLLSYRILATLYERTDRIPLCEPFFLAVEKGSFELKDTNLICSNLVFYGNFLRSQNKLLKAKEKIKLAIDLCKLYGDKQSLETALIFYKTLLYDLGEYKKAFEVSNEIFSLDKEIYLKENQNQINNFETQLKTKEIAQEKEIAEAKTLVETQRKNNYIFILLLVIFVSIILFLIIFLRNSKRSTRIKLQFQEDRLASIIEGQEHERTRIAKELHDGIVQDLTVLKMNLIRDKNLNQVEEDLTKISKEVRELSYQMMPVSLQNLGLIKALEELFERSFIKNGIAFEFEFFEIQNRLSEKIEVSIYRICQELINNTLKYAQATQISIVLRKVENQITFIFEDNGLGFDSSQVKLGIGLQSLYSRIEFINGNVDFDSSAKKGTSVFIRIPYSI